MKIPNPFRWHPHTKITSINEKGEKVVSVQPSGEWLEVGEEALEARIDAIDKGHSEGNVLETRMWGREMGGVMDVQAFMAKKEMEKERQELEELKKKVRKPAKPAKEEKLVKEEKKEVESDEG